jgi:hypothetical protein
MKEVKEHAVEVRSETISQNFIAGEAEKALK